MDSKSWIDFSPALLGSRSEELRQTIRDALEGNLRELLLVETVFDAARNPACYESDSLYLWYLLLDVHRAFLYRRGGSRVGADSVARSIADGYEPECYTELEQHFGLHGFKDVHGLRKLEVLKVVCDSASGNSVTILDFVSGDISVTGARIHPEVNQSLNSEPHDSVEGLKFSMCKVGQNLRQVAGDPPLALKSTASPDLGIVREEHLVIHSAALPISVNRMSFRLGKTSMLCCGKAFKPSQAVLVARCEALERYQMVLRSPACSLVYGSQRSLRDKTIDPRSLFFDTGRHKAADKRVQYSDDLPMYWIWADDLSSSEKRLVPAQEIWFNTDSFEDEHLCITNTTNACAVGQCLEEAAIFSLFEAIERDAFLATWYLRRACDQIAAASVRFEPFQILWARLRAGFPNYRFHFFDICSDIAIPTVAALAVRASGTGPKILMAAAVHLRTERAMFSALKDLGVSLSGNMKNYHGGNPDALPLDPEDVVSPDDHRALYSRDVSFSKLSFLGFDAQPRLTDKDIDDRSWVPSHDSFDLKEILGLLIERLDALGVRVLMKDISHPELAATGLRCVKAIGVGLYPMWFGYYGIRFAVTPRLKRLAEMWGARMSQESDINLELHPFD